jgi:hypothetical protein
MNFDSELIKLLAALGGVVSSSILVYEKFIRKAKLNLEIEYSGLVKRGNKVDFKIDLNITAMNEDIYLKEVFLFNKNFFNFRRRKLPFNGLSYHVQESPGTWSINFKHPIKKIRLDKAVKGGRLNHIGDITELVGNEFIYGFIDEWQSLCEEDFEEHIRGQKIASNSRIFLTFLGTLTIAEDLSSSENDVPHFNWYVCFDYGKGCIKRKVFKRIRL